MTGAQKVIEEALHQYIEAQGHHSCVLYMRGQSDLADVIRCENKLENVSVRFLRRFCGKRHWYARLQTKRMINYIQQFEPDVIHLHVLHGGCIDYEMLLRYLGKIQIPVVYTMHDMWAFTGGCYHYVYEKCEGYRYACCDCKALPQRLDAEAKNIARVFRMKKELLEGLNALHCVTVSNWVAEEMKKSFLAEYPIHVIYNGVEYQENQALSIQKPDTNTESIRIICVASYWDQNKGLETIYELARLLDGRFQIILVGNVDDESRIGAPDNIEFTGYCENREKLFSLFSMSDIHVTASKVETFGMTMIEAAMAGIRSIGFACTAIAEVLEQVHGVGVKERNAVALFEAVMRVVDEGRCHLNGDEVMEICKKFSIDRMVHEYMELYEKVVS